jgi:cobalt/nickel transport protein
MSRVSTKALVVTGLLVALLLAGVVSFYASTSPDGLNRVAEDKGFSKTQSRHASDGSPFAGYGTEGVSDGRLSKGVAGVVGCVVVLALAGGLIVVVRRRGAREDEPQTVDHGGS